MGSQTNHRCYLSYRIPSPDARCCRSLGPCVLRLHRLQDLVRLLPLKEQYGKDLFQLVSSSRLLLINNLVVEHSIDRDQQLIEKLLNQALHTLGDVSLVYAEELGSDIAGDSRESRVLAREASMQSIERFVPPLPLSFWHALWTAFILPLKAFLLSSCDTSSRMLLRGVSGCLAKVGKWMRLPDVLRVLLFVCSERITHAADLYFDGTRQLIFGQGCWEICILLANCFCQKLVSLTLDLIQEVVQVIDNATFKLSCEQFSCQSKVVPSAAHIHIV